MELEGIMPSEINETKSQINLRSHLYMNQSNKQKLPQTNKHTKDRGLSTQKYLGNGGLNRVKQIILLLLQCISESLNLLICSIISQRE